MARRRRSRNQRGRGGRKNRPGVKSLLGWLIPLATLAGLADWMVISQMLEHYRKHGHVCPPGVGLVFALSLTGTAVAIPFIWVQLRRQAMKTR